MQVIYAAPFIGLSLLAFLTCLAIPRFRRYKLQALVAPVAFGFCSIVGLLAILLIADLLGERFRLKFFSEPASITFLLFYCTPGFLGSWLAVIAVRKFLPR